MACTCQQCGRRYRVDLLVPDDLWERIKPKGKPEGAGLLCGACIMGNIERLERYGALHAFSETNGGDSMERIQTMVNTLKEASDQLPGGLTPDAAKDMLLLAECITAALQGYLFKYIAGGGR